MSKVVEVSDQNFEMEVIKSDIPVVIDFWAPWCGPCRRVSPIIEKLSEEYTGRIKFGKINVDENPDMAREYQVMNIPYLLFVKDGQQADSVLGAVPEMVLRSTCEALL